MTELEWIERAVEAYKHLSTHGRAVLSAHAGGVGLDEKQSKRGRGVKGYWLQMSAVQRKKEMRCRGLIR